LSGGADLNRRPLPWQGSILPLNYRREHHMRSKVFRWQAMLTTELPPRVVIRRANRTMKLSFQVLTLVDDSFQNFYRNFVKMKSTNEQMDFITIEAENLWIIGNVAK
jgi:hypothetical protein